MTCEYKVKGYCQIIGLEFLGEYANPVQVNRDLICELDYTQCEEFKSEKNAEVIEAGEPLPYEDNSCRETINLIRSLKKADSWTLLQDQA